MSERLRELAARVASELAARDLGSRQGAPPEKEDNAAASILSHLPVAAAIGPSPENGSPSASHRPRLDGRAERITDFIDHTLLKAEATHADIDALCQEAREQRFAAVCVNPVWVPHCATALGGSGVGLATVVGFPLGASASRIKQNEAALAVDQGATEIDMVAAIGHIKGGDWRHVADDITAVVRGSGGRLVKVIIESAVLTPVEIIKASALAKECGAHFVKTSTGFHPAGGASAEAVALMRLVVGDALGVKASGGVRDCSTALRMIASGATRIGTSSGVAMAECIGKGPLPLSEILSLSQAHGASCTHCQSPVRPGPSGEPSSY
ncbi:MAG: Deoxyribose-phosphate aldolase [Gemmatimonadaceae bacterium]|nr:Deoxyribose-phosphate aldolase [Gemmatimonadaceae bacterium]